MIRTMEASSTRYRVLAGRIEAQVRAGSLKAGARLPSVREHAVQQGVSITTVLQAYRTLEDLGVIEARPKSGFFVKARVAPPREPLPSRPPQRPRVVERGDIVELVLHATNDRRYVSFGSAQASSELYPNERLRRAIARQAQRDVQALGRYAAPYGTIALRQAIAHHTSHLGCDIEHHEVLVTHGCREAIDLCLRAVTSPGDIVAIESPTYFGFLGNLHAMGLRALEIPTHPRLGMSIDALELALDTQPVRAIVVVPTVSNPLGSTMPPAAKKRLAQIAAQRKVPIIEDVICNDLAATEEARRAVRAYDRTGNVMLCGSFSKTLAPGLAMGWVSAGKWVKAVAAHKLAASAAPVSVLEHALAELLQRGGYETSLRRLRRAFAEQVEQGRRLVAEHFPSGTRATNPSGSFFLWVELPRGVDALELFSRCLDQSIVVAPGTLFTTTSRFQNCIRLNVGELWTATRVAAMATIGRLARELQDRTQTPKAPAIVGQKTKPAEAG